jgi:ABC-type transport system involved in multi-copper enzyme maturation permease subunit
MSATTALAGEAVRDAGRRRIVAVIIALSLVSLMLVDGCTSCAAGNITVNGEVHSLQNVSGASGTALFVFLGLWIILLAGILGSDHLQQTLEDGSAQLCLSRPISRAQFAFARLAGVLTCGALGMTLSLFVPRVASLLVVTGTVAVISIANVLSLVSPGAGILSWIDRVGPPLASSLWITLDPWVEGFSLASGDGGTGALAWVWIRSILWALASAGILAWVFRRLEIPH